MMFTKRPQAHSRPHHSFTLISTSVKLLLVAFLPAVAFLALYYQPTWAVANSAMIAPITIHSAGFEPAHVTITPGTQVIWTNSTQSQIDLYLVQVWHLYLPTVRQGDAESRQTDTDAAADTLLPTFLPTQTPGHHTYFVQPDTESVSIQIPLEPNGSFSYTFQTEGEYVFSVSGFQSSGSIRVTGVIPPTSTPTPTPTPTQTPASYSVDGYVQKGPYIQGTEIIVRELDSNLNPTGRTFAGSIDSNSGHFSVRGELAFPLVELSANGYYFNEVAGSLSVAQLNLQALADLQDISTVNVNLLTHLERSRVLFLVSGGMTLSQAKTQAQREILRIFNIESTGIGASETLDISQEGDGNAILLAISAVLQSNKSEAQLTELLSIIGSDIRLDGTLDNISARNALVAGMEYIKPYRAAIRDNITDRYTEIGIDTQIPAFETFAFKLDTIVPTVASTWPNQGEDQDVSQVVVGFSELVEHATLNFTAIRLQDMTGGVMTGTLSIIDANAATTVTLTPDSILLAGAYTLTIGSAIQDYAGNGIGQDIHVVFTNTPNPAKRFPLYYDSSAVQGTILNAFFQPWSVPPGQVPISGTLVYGNADGTNANGCAPYSESMTGKVVLADRGACNFTLKAMNASVAGAIISLIGMNESGQPFEGGDGGDRPIDIPSFMIDENTSALLKEQIANGVIVGVVIND